MGSAGKGQVRTRRVFYIPGYDPFHPRRYRELYRKEGAEQAAISGYDISLKARSGDGRFGWDAAAHIDGVQVSTQVEVLVWSDIVRDSMGQSIRATYAALLRTAWIYISTGALFRLMRLRKGPVIAALYPVVMLIAQAGVGLLLGHLAGRFLSSLTHLALGPDGPTWGSQLVYWAAFGAVLWFVLELSRRWDNRSFVHYLMHDYAYSARHRGANPPALEARIAAFSERIGEALASDVDEVLVVGHSSGAHLGVSALADLLRHDKGPTSGPALGFLSLGQVVPMVSFLPRAHRLRADLHDLCKSDQLTWIDVTAPGDGCAFALCDPVSVSGVAPETGKRWPVVFSAAFTQTLSPQRWKALRWRFFRLHFQYLCAFDAPRDYDYFQITAGPLTLAQRYADRASSKSRIETPVNRHTSRAA